MKILLVCAVAAELADKSLPPNVDVLITGLGPIEAGAALSHALAIYAINNRSRYDLVLNVGIAGGFAGRELSPGSTVLIDEENYADLGREDHSPLSLPVGVTLETKISIDLSAIPRFREIHDICTSAGTRVGGGLTSAQITTSETRAESLLNRFPRILTESMEGFALARVAERYHTPFLELRGISNLVGVSNAHWDLPTGIRAVNTLLEAILTNYGVFTA